MCKEKKLTHLERTQRADGILKFKEISLFDVFIKALCIITSICYGILFYERKAKC